jgi:hypothetical protein
MNETTTLPTRGPRASVSGMQANKQGSFREVGGSTTTAPNIETTARSPMLAGTDQTEEARGASDASAAVIRWIPLAVPLLAAFLAVAMYVVLWITAGSH